MLTLERPSLVAAGLTVFGDHADDAQYYYAAPNPRIASTGGQPMFDIFSYAVELKQSPLAGTTIPDELGAGFLTMGVDCALDEAKRTQAVQALALQLGRDPDTIRLSPIPYTRGSVSVIALDAGTTGTAPAAPAATPGRPRFVEQVLGAGTPSLLGDLRSIFSLSLSQDGVTLLEGLLADGAAPIGVVYSLTFLGLRPSVQARIHADVSRIYQEFGGKASVGCAYVRGEIEGTLSKLVQTGAVTIELTSEAMGEEAQHDKELALSLFKDRIIQELFSPAPQMPSFTIPAIPGQASQTPPSLVTLSLKARKDEELRTVDYDFSERSPEERTHAPQGFLATLLTPEELAARTHQVDLASDFFELLEVLVSGPSADEFAALSLRSVTVDLVYGTDGDPALPAEQGTLVFRPGSGTDLTWAVRRKSRPTLAYAVDVTYEFDRVSSVDADALTYRTGPRSETGRTLSIRPYDDFAVLDVEVDLGRLDAGITQVDVALDYQDSTIGFAAHDQLRLAPASPAPIDDRSWQVRTRTAGQRSYTASSTLTFDDGTVLALPPVVTSDELFQVDAPFRANRSLLVQPNVSSDEVTSITLEVTYDDEAAGYHRRFQRTLTPAPPPDGQPAPAAATRWQPVTLTWPILDPARQQIRYRVTTAAGGVVDAGDWQETTDPSLLVGDVGQRKRVAEVHLIGPGLVDAGLDAIQVRVTVAGAAVDSAASVFFDPTSPVAQTVTLSADPDSPAGFRYQTTSFHADGTQRQSEWTDTTQALIAISTRTV